MHILVSLGDGKSVEYPDAKTYTLKDSGLLKVHLPDGETVAFPPGGYESATLPVREPNLRTL